MRITPERVVMITGASSGIGHALALTLAPRRCTLVLAARRREKLDALASNLLEQGARVLVQPCDVSVHSQCTELIRSTHEQCGRIDVLVNNAAYGLYAPVEHISTAELQKLLDTNLFGPLWLTQAVIPFMKAKREGHIVNVSSVIGYRSIPTMSAYCMSKFALNALDEALRLELRSLGIDVTLIAPGLTRTNFQSRAHGQLKPLRSNDTGMAPEKVARAILRAIEMRRSRVLLTHEGKLLNLLQRLSPKLLDAVIFRAYARRGILPY